MKIKNYKINKVVLCLLLCAASLLLSTTLDAKPVFSLLNGPPCVGALKMIKESSLVKFSVAGSIDATLSSLAKGELDIATIPSNLAAVIYNRGMDYKAVAIVVESVFVIVSSDTSITKISDLKGKTIHCGVKGANPDIILRYMLKDAGFKNKDIKINYSLGNPDIARALVSKVIDTGVLLEPYITMTLKGNKDVRVILDSSKADKMPFALLIAKDSLTKQQPELLKKILGEYKASTEFMLANPKSAETLVPGSGLSVSGEIIKDSMSRIGLVFHTGNDMQQKLEKYYQFLYNFEPVAIGHKRPKAEFYWNY